MCTLSVVTRDDGYLLAMNRDELTTRKAAERPSLRQLRDARVLCPSEDAGGTWIAVNNHGISLALLNWNDAPAPATGKLRSRGEVIPQLIGLPSYREIDSALSVLDFNGVFPFRLIGVFPREKILCEWRWDRQWRTGQAFAWENRHWFSSSRSDREAQELRGRVCSEAAREPDAGNVAWLRRLHASHAGGPGPFSVCVHRPDAKTVSYTEISCSTAQVSMGYFGESPCEMGGMEAALNTER